MAEFSAPIEDRRSVTIRLVVLQVGCAVVFTILAFSFWYFQVVQHEKFSELAENNHQRTIRAARAARRDARSQRRGARRKPQLVHHLHRPRAHEGSRPHDSRRCRQVAGLDPKYVQDVVNRHRREPTYRPIVIVDDASLAQVAAVLARQSGDARRAGRRSADAAVSDGLVCGASVRIRRRSERRAGRERRPAERRHRGAGRRREDLQQAVDGRGRREGRASSTAWGAKSTRSKEIPPNEGRRVQLTIDIDLQRAAEEGVQGRRVQRRGGRDGSANGRSARVYEPSRLRPERFRRGRRTRDVERPAQPIR